MLHEHGLAKILKSFKSASSKLILNTPRSKHTSGNYIAGYEVVAWTSQLQNLSTGSVYEEALANQAKLLDATLSMVQSVSCHMSCYAKSSSTLHQSCCVIL